MIKGASGSLEPSPNISLRHRGTHMKPELVGGCINHKPQAKASCKKMKILLFSRLKQNLGLSGTSHISTKLLGKQTQ